MFCRGIQNDYAEKQLSEQKIWTDAKNFSSTLLGNKAET